MKPYGCLIIFGAVFGLIVTAWASQHWSSARSKSNKGHAGNTISYDARER